MYHYVYKIVFETGHLYYGARTSKVPPNKDQNYVGTPYTYKSYWKDYNYEKFIIDEFSTKEEALDFEANLIKDFWETFGKELSLNANYRNEKFSRLGTTLSPEDCERIAIRNSKGCFLISPEGQMFDIPNLYLFCKEKGFDTKFKNKLNKVYRGEDTSYKGWTNSFYNYLVLKFYGESKSANRSFPLKLKNSKLGTLTVYCVSSFAKEHHISRTSIIKLRKGERLKIFSKTTKSYWELA